MAFHIRLLRMAEACGGKRPPVDKSAIDAALIDAVNAAIAET
jgi:hypothetical protein